GRVLPASGAIVSRLRPSQGALSNFIAIGEPMQQGHRLIQGEGGGILGSIYDPMRICYDVEAGVLLGDTRPPAGVLEERVARRRRLRSRVDDRARGGDVSPEAQALNRFYEQAFSLMTSGEAAHALDLRREREALRDRYGRYRFGQSCLLARRLVEIGIPLI